MQALFARALDDGIDGGEVKRSLFGLYGISIDRHGHSVAVNGVQNRPRRIHRRGKATGVMYLGPKDEEGLAVYLHLVVIAMFFKPWQISILSEQRGRERHRQQEEEKATEWSKETGRRVTVKIRSNSSFHKGLVIARERWRHF